jgi:hypothetical protein
MKTSILFCAILMLASSSAFAAEEPRTVVPDIGVLLETARVHGEAHGILGGESAAKLHAIGVNQPMLVDVTTLGNLQQKDCCRLLIVITQKSVLMPGWKEARDRNTQFEMNQCPGGKPPASEAQAKIRP